MVDNSSFEIWMVGSDSYLDNQGWRIKTQSMFCTYKPIPRTVFAVFQTDNNTSSNQSKGNLTLLAAQLNRFKLLPAVEKA